MMRSDCSNGLKTTMALLGLMTIISLMSTSCVKHDELSFTGTVVGVRNCTSTYLDQNAGLIVKLTTPTDVGGTMTSTNGETMDNVVVLYQPNRRVMVEDNIHGTFYLDNKYSKANCSLIYSDLELPEGVITNVVVD
ncbi:MAG: hypothetical protein J6W88_03255 [Bacteroidales bacterium]|nr:hypothetical protein [Bacteroidales bacterium]